MKVQTNFQFLQDKVRGSKAGPETAVDIITIIIVTITMLSTFQ